MRISFLLKRPVAQNKRSRLWPPRRLFLQRTAVDTVDRFRDQVRGCSQSVWTLASPFLPAQARLRKRTDLIPAQGSEAIRNFGSLVCLPKGLKISRVAGQLTFQPGIAVQEFKRNVVACTFKPDRAQLRRAARLRPCVLNGRLWPCCGVVHSRCHAQMSLRLIALIPPMSGFLCGIAASTGMPRVSSTSKGVRKEGSK